MPADKAYLSGENVEAVAALDGTAFIPPKSTTIGGAGGFGGTDEARHAPGVAQGVPPNRPACALSAAVYFFKSFCS